MRLKISQAAKNTHSKLVVDVGWAGAELFSVADDKQIVRHRVDGTVIGDDVKQNARAGAAAAAAGAGGGDAAGKMDLGDVFATCFHWLAGGNNTFEVFALGCSSGAIRLMTRGGRIEREIKDAHSGAVTAIRWNDDGSGFISGGEDGLLKHWSRNGNLRSKLASSDRAIYSCVWSPDAQSVLYASGQYVCILPAQPSNNAKPIKWKAHDATVLKVDWNAINNQIVTGGEDKKYRLWDSYGRQLFSSKTQEYAITSVRWAPNGNYFAVGSYDTIALCDKTGWTHSRETCKSGSILALDWTSDGTHVAGAGATGAVCFGQLVERSLEWKNYEITLTEANQVIVTDIASDAGGQGDEFEFGGGRVIDMSLNWNHLIVCTDKKCYIYMLQNLSTPQVMDLVGGGTVNLILQCPQYFALVDNVRGIQVFTYEGKAVSNPKLASLKPQLLRAGNIALSNDHIAVIDRNNPKQIHLLDTLSGRAMDQPIKHNLDIVELALNQTQSVTDRKLFFIDRNRDLFITAAIRPTPFKLATMADTAMWNDTSDILAAVSDSKLLVWYCPVAAFIDKDLLHYTRSQTDATSFGKNSQLITFYDTRLQVRKSDGATQTASINPVPSYLIRYCTTGQWQKAVRLCRWSPTGAGHGGGAGAAGRDDVLWSTLAVLSIVNGQLDTAEVALAALDEVDKLQFIQQVKAVPTPEGRNAELLLYQRKHDAAESALLQAKLIYRAIQLNIRIFRWARALDLAVQHKTHIDTVLHYRARYLAAAGGDKETDKRFAQFATDVKVDPKVVAEKEAAEREAEEKRGTPYKAVADTKVDVKAEPEPSAFANTVSSPKNAAADSPSNGGTAAAAGSGSTPSVSRTASVTKTPAKKADTDVKVAPRQHKKGTRIDIDND